MSRSVHKTSTHLLDSAALATNSPGCFPAGTLVTVRWCGTITYKPIELINVGDEVLTHLGRWRRVTRLQNKTADTIVLRDINGHRLELTPDHKLWCSPNGAPNSGRCKASASFDLDRDHWARIPLDGSDTLADPDKGMDPSLFHWSFVASAHKGRDGIRVYNIEVDQDHSYVAEGVVVKNSCSQSRA